MCSMSSIRDSAMYISAKVVGGCMFGVGTYSIYVIGSTTYFYLYSSLYILRKTMKFFSLMNESNLNISVSDNEKLWRNLDRKSPPSWAHAKNSFHQILFNPQNNHWNIFCQNVVEQDRPFHGGWELQFFSSKMAWCISLFCCLYCIFIFN